MKGDCLSKPDRYPWLLLTMLAGAYFLNQADRAIFGVVLPLIKTDLGLSDAELGGIATILFLVLTLVVPVAGLLADRVSRKALVAGSLIFWSISTMLTGFATGVTSLVLLRGVATGGGEAVYTPAAYSLIGASHGERRGFALSIHQMALYVGLIASGAIGGYVAQLFGWRAAFYVFGAAGMLLGLLMVYAMRPDIRAQSPGESSKSPSIIAMFGRFASNPVALTLALAFGCYMVVTNAYAVWAPELFHEKFGLGVAAAGTLAMVVHHATAMFGVLLGGWFSDRWAKKSRSARILLQAVALGLAAPFILLMATLKAFFLSCLAIAIFGFFRGIYDSNIQASLFEVVPAGERGTAWSLMVVIGFLIGSGSPFLTGFLKQQIGGSQALSTIFGAYCAIYALGAALLLVAWLLMRPQLKQEVLRGGLVNRGF